MFINIKETIYQKLRNSNGNTFSLTPPHVLFSNQVWTAASKDRMLTTLFSTKMDAAKRETFFEKHNHMHINIPRVPSLLPSLYIKNIKNPRPIRKFKHARHVDRQLCIFFVQILKAVSISFINWSENFILRGWFQIYSVNNNTLYLWSQYFNKQGCDFTVCSGVEWNAFNILKFNILSPHYVRHYCACIECQTF